MKIVVEIKDETMQALQSFYPSKSPEVIAQGAVNSLYASLAGLGEAMSQDIEISQGHLDAASPEQLFSQLLTPDEMRP